MIDLLNFKLLSNAIYLDSEKTDLKPHLKPPCHTFAHFFSVFPPMQATWPLRV